jgi:hypothetical protein
VLYALAFSPSGTCLLAAGSEEVVHGFKVPAGTRRAVVRLTRSRWAQGSTLLSFNPFTLTPTRTLARRRGAGGQPRLPRRTLSRTLSHVIGCRALSSLTIAALCVLQVG